MSELERILQRIKDVHATFAAIVAPDAIAIAGITNTLGDLVAATWAAIAATHGEPGAINAANDIVSALEAFHLLVAARVLDARIANCAAFVVAITAS